MSEKDLDDPTRDVTRATKIAGVLGVVFTVGAFALYDVRSGAGVLIGAGIAVANLLTMRAIIRALVQEPLEAADESKPAPAEADHKSAGRRGGTAWGIFAAFKIVILFGGIWLLLTRKWVDPMPLVVGYGVLPLGIAASSLFGSLRLRR